MSTEWWSQQTWPCKCQGNDPWVHVHYDYDSDDRHRCARCIECEGYQPDIPEWWAIRMLLGPEISQADACRILLGPAPAPASTPDSGPDDTFADWVPEFTVWLVRYTEAWPMVVDTVFLNEADAKARAAVRGPGWWAMRYSHIQPLPEQSPANEPVADLARRLRREAEFINEYAPQRALLLRVAGEIEAAERGAK